MKEPEVLTKTFTFISFPKPIHKKVSKSRRKGHQVIKFKASKRIIKELLKKPSRSKLIKQLDKLFSDYLKKHYSGKCFKCSRISKNAGVSHYFSRKYMGTRWDLENCQWSCWACHFHQLEHLKQPGEWYYRWMERNTNFKKLEIKAHAITKYSVVDLQLLIDHFNELYKN